MRPTTGDVEWSSGPEHVQEPSSAPGDFQQSFRAAVALGSGADPGALERMLEQIVRTAMRAIPSEASALLLVDEAAGELSFEILIGGGGEAVRDRRLSVGAGSLPGLVVATGQAHATRRVEEDSPFAVELSKNTGYLPRNILCVPLFHQEQVIGALELLDRVGAASFDLADMDLLGEFAALAADTIVQRQQHRRWERLLLPTPGAGEVGGSGGASPDLVLPGEDAAAQGALGLAALVHEIARQGEAESRACRSLLAGFADYLRDRTRQSERVEGDW